MTTTGFAIADFSIWPEFSKMIVLGLMFIGACAGSTGGGIKVSRLIILLKQAKKEIHLLFHPKAVKQVQLDGKTVEHSVVRSVNNYMIIYLLVFTASLLLVSLDKFDFNTNFSAVAATMNNIGPGFCRALWKLFGIQLALQDRPDLRYAGRKAGDPADPDAVP